MILFLSQFPRFDTEEIMCENSMCKEGDIVKKRKQIKNNIDKSNIRIIFDLRIY